MKYYDRAGNPISLATWSHLLNDPDYQVLKQSRGVGKIVSTIWLGLDHSFGGGPPLFFETMVFPLDAHGEMIPNEIAGQRYSTEEQAMKGHEEMCLSYIKPLDLMVKKLEEDDAGLVDPDGEGESEAAGEG